MRNPSARIERCTILRGHGDFCDSPSIEDAPFPVCAKHAIKLYAHLSDLTDDERATLEPVPGHRIPKGNALRREQNAALRAMQAGQTFVYAVRFPDGIIKIGCSTNLAQRFNQYRVDKGELLGFMPGDYALEQEIHQTLRDDRARGREWYHPTPGVIAIVNEMRDGFDMPHIAA
jgi:hypothetical protein